jgi:hypothetical protein
VLYRTSLHLREAHSPAYRDFKIENLGIAVWRIIYMHRAHRYVSGLILTVALVASGSIVAAATPQEAGSQVRIYDSSHHDYHNWDDREDHAYRGYLTDHHQDYRAFDKQSHKQQNDYWNWRHQHPDND